MSASTSCNGRAQALLDGTLAGAPADVELARSLARDGCSEALFRIVVEGLADRFELRLCNAYAELFSAVIAEALPGYHAAALLERYARVRIPRACEQNPERVFVLSRVTLGADIAVTSVLLSAAKQRFPHASIALVGSSKIAELWSGDQRIEHVAAPYPRGGSLADRLLASTALRTLIGKPRSIVLDPDSRLTQLGLVPVCDEADYFFFESRSFAGQSSDALPELAAQWCEAVLGIHGASPYLSLAPKPAARQQIAVSLGVGENAAKRLGSAFEAGLLAALAEEKIALVIDAGAGGEEAERVHMAVRTSGVQAEIWKGSFAGFASRIAESTLYVGYDSAGQHAAAALGTPLITVFSGHVSQRMFERWKPTGRGRIEVVNAENLAPEEALQRTIAAIGRIRTL